MNLSEEQQAQMKEIRVKFLKETQDSRNQLEEMRAHQHTLMTADQPNEKEIYRNIDQMTQVKKEMMKERIKMQTEVNSILTEEQRLMRGNRSFGLGKGDRRGEGFARNRNCEFGPRERGGEMNGRGKGRMQGQEKGKRHDALNLSDQQKEQMQELRLAHLKKIQPIQNELDEIRVKQRNLMSAGQPDMKALMANADKVSDLRNQMMKEKVTHRLEVRKVLNEDQRVLWDARPMRKGHPGKHYFCGAGHRCR